MFNERVGQQTVAMVPWARHDSAFTRAFEDLVVHDAIVGNKQAAADRYGTFFDALGAERSAALQFVTEDGASWIRDVVAVRAPDAIVCLDTFHVISWATDALDEVRRGEWNKLRQVGAAKAAKQFKGLRFWLRRNWEHLTMATLDHHRARGSEPADLPGMTTQGGAEGHLRPAPQPGASSARCLAGVGVSVQTRPVREARPQHPPLPRLDRSDIEWRLTNGIAESNNASIGRLRTNARGFHDPQAFITMVMLDRAGIGPDLPWTTR